LTEDVKKKKNKKKTAWEVWCGLGGGGGGLAAPLCFKHPQMVTAASGRLGQMSVKGAAGRGLACTVE
jgi:hypothetical protein